MIQKLLAYQTVDAKLKDIENQINKSEVKKLAVVAKKFLETVNETLAKLDKRAEELMNVFNSLNKEKKALLESAKEFENTIESLEDESETTYMMKKADEIYSKISALEEEVNKLNEEITGIFAQYSQLKNDNAKYKAQYQENYAKYKALQEEKHDETENIKKELASLAKDIPVELMAKYTAKRNDKVFPVLHKLNDRMCSKCGMEVSMAEITKLNNGEVIECDTCRCLIYKA